MSDIAVGARPRRRKPPWKLLAALAWLLLDLGFLAYVTFRMARGDVTPLAVFVLLGLLFLLPPEWWTVKRELERWRHGD